MLLLTVLLACLVCSYGSSTNGTADSELPTTPAISDIAEDATTINNVAEEILNNVTKATTNTSMTTANTTDISMSTTNTTELDPKVNCEAIDSCEDCMKQNCYWLKCFNDRHSCLMDIPEFCGISECSTTPSPNNTTTSMTSESTTTLTPTTTVAPTTVPPPDTTTEISTPSTIPSTSTSMPSSSTTSMPSTTTAAPPPHERHFDGASFIGGIIFATLLGGLGFGGWMYYKKKILAHRYANF